MNSDTESTSSDSEQPLSISSVGSSPTHTPAKSHLFTPDAPVRRGRTIAVLINSSEVCLRAVRHAVKLVLDDPEGGRLLLLHAINLCTSPLSPADLQQLSHDLLEKADVPVNVPARVVITFRMHGTEDDKEAIAIALCKKAELLGATELCMVETNGIPHLPIIVGAIAKAVVYSSRIPVTLIKASNKGEKGAENSVRDQAWKGTSSPYLKTFSSRMQGLLAHQRSCGA